MAKVPTIWTPYTGLGPAIPEASCPWTTAGNHENSPGPNPVCRLCGQGRAKAQAATTQAEAATAHRPTSTGDPFAELAICSVAGCSLLDGHQVDPH